MHCQKMALSALLAVPGFLRTHPHNCQNSSESAHFISKFTGLPIGSKDDAETSDWLIGLKLEDLEGRKGVGLKGFGKVD